MKLGSFWSALAAIIFLSLFAGIALADGQATATPAELYSAGYAKEIVAAEPVRTPAAVNASDILQRLEALKKENLVLREDLGKARLDARTELEALAKRQAEAIAELNEELVRTQEQLAAERNTRRSHNRDIWVAVGVVALGALMAN